MAFETAMALILVGSGIVALAVSVWLLAEHKTKDSLAEVTKRIDEHLSHTPAHGMDRHGR